MRNSGKTGRYFFDHELIAELSQALKLPHTLTELVQLTGKNRGTIKKYIDIMTDNSKGYEYSLKAFPKTKRKVLFRNSILYQWSTS